MEAGVAVARPGVVDVRVRVHGPMVDRRLHAEAAGGGSGPAGEVRPCMCQPPSMLISVNCLPRRMPPTSH